MARRRRVAGGNSLATMDTNRNSKDGSNMRIELKNVVYSERLSEETAAFAAIVYVDGKKRGEAKNDGHGGMTFIHPPELAREIEVYAATLPRRPFGHGMEGDYQPDADMVIGDILAEYLAGRRLKRLLARNTLFVREGRVYSMKQKGLRPKDAGKGSVVLNDLPFDEALKMYIDVLEKAS